ncbi:Substrate-specific component PdxU2 of predicted pyridoxin-related ECF transporter [Thermococcus sp. 2319x1]|uniref:ECF transporter S component n=1 Tax=Thermococcus sp. 2319x1 TaxID=1674923 RepID=UPI00073A81A7|nr:ECF transporter S component [Thermococcus sp. 2319x1]ALV63012.1 Substrate-specific component PdxU2 of predicted pyridoxin-related ECF transporter [Thermococcus sp. 2319x1]
MATEALAPYGKWVLTAVAVLYFVYLFVLKKKVFEVAVGVALSGIMAALVAVVTMLIQVPTPLTKGYINVGDSMVMLVAVLFGPTIGAFAGGFGSAMADLITGYAHWAPFTLVIKGVEGFVVGYLTSKKDDFTTILLATILGGALMVLGYFFVEVYFYGWGGAIAMVPGNTLQAVTGIVVGGGVGHVIKRRVKDMLVSLQI